MILAKRFKVVTVVLWIPVVGAEETTVGILCEMKLELVDVRALRTWLALLVFKVLLVVFKLLRDKSRKGYFGRIFGVVPRYTPRSSSRTPCIAKKMLPQNTP